MKYFCMTFLLCYSLSINTNAQITENKITAYSKFLSKRNARLIQCDTVAPYLEEIYASFIKALVEYRNGIRNRGALRQLRASYMQTKNHIYKLLDKRSRKVYKQLVKRTGNILLAVRINHNTDLFRISATLARLPV